MLTRLQVSGFKNLVHVDVRFGPFTCIAGPNGVGKSNLFDAIRFLSALADRPLVEAALSVRDEGGRTADIRSLFHRVGHDYATEMSFTAEMVIPQQARDDLGQQAKASITFLSYTLVLAYREDSSHLSLGALEIIKEELVHINRSDARKHLLFPHTTDWRNAAVQGKRSGGAFISTAGQGEQRVIKLHQDRGGGGRSLARPASDLPRTILSASNAAENPTALVARREIQSWRLLQLEPAALRQPDEFTAPVHLGMDGSHLPATLYRLARAPGKRTNGQAQDETTERIYSQIANRLAELIDDVHDLWIERDERREILTLHMKNREGTPHPARALSDGTLRFLALAVLELNPEDQGLLCLEEPENGIHPARIPAMLNLLQDLATDVDEPLGPDNPLRQVIVNTHSPALASQVDESCLLMAELTEDCRAGQSFKRVSFCGLTDTWRCREGGDSKSISKGQLLAYLNPVIPLEAEISEHTKQNKTPASISRRRVVDRPELQLLLPLAGYGE